MPVTGIDDVGGFKFRTELTEGLYEVVAGFGPFEVGSEAITIERRSRERSFKIVLEPRTPFRSADTAQLHNDEPNELPREGLLPNPDRYYPPPPPPPPPPGPGWAPDKNNVRVFYATNRQLTMPPPSVSGPLPVRAELFADKQDRLRFGYTDVGVTFKPASSRNPLSSDDYQFHTYSMFMFNGASAFSDALRTESSHKPTQEVLLHVHGYNVPFQDGIYRTAQFVVETGFQGVPVYFGWPGGGHWWEYPDARKQVTPAAAELATLLKVLVESASITKLHVVAHSLGNRVLLEALDRLAIDPAMQSAHIANLVMAAPDVSAGGFNQSFRTLLSLFERRAVYVSDTDWALRAGRTFDGESRIGQRTPLSVGAGFETVDATGAKDTIIGHAYFVDTDTIANDIAAFVVKGLAAAQRGLQSINDSGVTLWRLPQLTPP